MAVHAVGRTGHKRDEVLAIPYSQARSIVGQDDLGRGHPVGMLLAQHPYDEVVADDELVQGIEDHRGGQARVPGQDGMGAGTTHRQR